MTRVVDISVSGKYENNELYCMYVAYPSQYNCPKCHMDIRPIYKYLHNVHIHI